MKKEQVVWLFTIILMVAVGVKFLWSQQTGDAGMVPVSMIVSVEARHGKEAPAIYKQDVRVMHDHDRLQVSDWTPCQSEQPGVGLFVLVDDVTNPDIGLQFADLKKFIEAQPPSTQIGVGYARNGEVEISQNFTKDRSQAEKALHLPVGYGAENSPYLSINDLIKRWPQTSACREILMVSSGIDYLQGGPEDSYLLEAIDTAERAGVQAYAIYASALGHAGHSFFRLNWGQNDLAQLTDETGGEFYIQGIAPPISYAPYLGDYASRLTHQFKLTFLAKAGKKPEFQKIRLETEVNNAELISQQRVWVPAQ